MAKVRNNMLVRGLSGAVGEQFVIRKDKAGRTIVGNMPEFDENREFSEAQVAHQEDFKEAAAYGKGAKGQDVYVAKAEGTPMTPYNVAVADWFHEPEIKDIDLSGWNGQAGQTIRIEAVDDVQVKQVTVVITDETGTVLEQGAAVQADSLWWTYTTTKAASGTPKVIASAQDLPGHIAQMTK
jgi:hypothetical protein